MGATELFALSLGLSVVVGSTTYALMRLIEGRLSDPWLREKAWALALHLPALPVLVIGLMSALPPLPPALAASEVMTGPSSFMVELTVGPADAAGFNTDGLALAVLGLAGLLGVTRAIRLAVRVAGLHRFMQHTRAAPKDVIDVIESIARRAFATLPIVRITDEGSQALIAGAFRPVLVLPTGLITPGGIHALEAICAHELAHIRRNDHRTIWFEETLLTVLAFNPLLGPIRARRSAAREEACDAEALRHSADETRRLYARSLIDALRASSADRIVPALTFTSSRRILVMRRLKAILSPVPVSATRHRLTMLGLGLAVATVAGTASFALAAQRAPADDLRPVAMPAARPISASPPVAAVRAVPASLPRAVAVPRSAPAPSPVKPASPAPVVAPETAPITNVAWVQSPMPSWPAAASTMAATSGNATLSCIAKADGHLSDCKIVREDPVGAGFGAAAVEAAERARLSPATIDAGAAGKAIQFGVRFRLAE